MTRTIDSHRHSLLRGRRLALGAPGLLLAALALLCPAAAAQAQEIPKDRVPFKVTIKGPSDVFLVPGNPAILSVRESGTGEATPLGAFTWVAHLIHHLDLGTGQDLFDEAVGAFTAANGDAIYVKYATIARPSSSTPGLLVLEGAWAVTGGKGRFAGATGSGFGRWEVSLPLPGKPDADKATITWEGTVSAPKQ